MPGRIFCWPQLVYAGTNSATYDTTKGWLPELCHLAHIKDFKTNRIHKIKQKSGKILKMQLIWFKSPLNVCTAAAPLCRLERVLYRPTPVHGMRDKVSFPPPVWRVLPRLPSNRRHPRRRLSGQAAAAPHICTPAHLHTSVGKARASLAESKSISQTSFKTTAVMTWNCECLLQTRSLRPGFH